MQRQMTRPGERLSCMFAREEKLLLRFTTQHAEVIIATERFQRVNMWRRVYHALE